MAIFQYQCSLCSSVFEYLVSISSPFEVNCLSCGSHDVARSESTYFYPNKNFCPRDRELDKDIMVSKLPEIMSDQSQRCGGCGTDGAPGGCFRNQDKCKSGRGSGGCVGCSCGKK